MSFCLETYLQQSEDYKIHISRAGFRECAKLIKEKAAQVLYVKAGEKILGARLIGIPPIPVGINKEKKTVMPAMRMYKNPFKPLTSTPASSIMFIAANAVIIVMSAKGPNG